MNKSYADLACLLLRLSGFSLALLHGWGKVASLSSGQADRLIQTVSSLGFPMPVLFAWAAAFAEFGGGLAVGLGLWTRIAAAFAGFSMMVAAFGRHRAHLQLLHAVGLAPLSEETLKSWGSPELALFYLLPLVALTLTGGGRFSLDRLIGRKG